MLGDVDDGRTPPSARVLVALLIASLSVQTLVTADAVRAAVTIRVPQDYATIQAAVNAASPEDTIKVAPGTYTENVTIDRSISLVAATYDQSDPRNNTAILDGAGGTVVTISRGIDPGPTITGFVIRNGNNGIAVQSPATIEHSHIIDNQDAIDYVRGGGGIAVGNVMERSIDDNIDSNHPTVDLTIEDNEILQAGGDGIEVRLHDDAIAETTVITIRGNEIVGNRQDGIQLIDYFDDTDRLLVIERNLIKSAGLAGIGLMDNGVTREDFRAASIREPIRVFHNTFVDNDHGISGGDNLIALNNIFQHHTLAMKNVDANSIASYNIFWNNAVDAQGSIIDAATTLSTDPLLDVSSQLRPGSPAIDAGAAHFEWRGEVVMDQPSAAYYGAAPDLGWLEYVLGRVTVADFSFEPEALLVNPGSVVKWVFRGPSSHAATDSIGLGPTRAPLFDSGPKGTGEVYKFKFAAAGQYPYSSTAAAPTAMSGTIMVPVTIAPIRGSTATRFTVTWASKSLSGFGFSVQSRFKPEGSSSFTTWTSFGPVQTAPSAVFVPDRGPGTYQFRSQLRNATTGATSLRSTPTSITVTS